MKYMLDLYIYLVLKCTEFVFFGLGRANIFFCISLVVCIYLVRVY